MSTRWWWRFTHVECPACGRSETYRERVHEKARRGHYYEVGYDYCIERGSL